MGVAPVLERSAVAASVPVSAIADRAREVVVSIVAHVGISVDDDALAISVGLMIARHSQALSSAGLEDVAVGHLALNKHLVEVESVP